jgi:DNA repair exonuclease SbcCD nuclease subunit
MKIFHFSDNHGRFEWLREAISDDVDLIISTGDFFPNCSRVDRTKEVRHQTWILDENMEFFKDVFGGRPFMCVDGNHDFIPLGQGMLIGGYAETIPVTPEGVMYGGLRFAGFPEVPYFTGEWNRESEWEDLRDLVDDTFHCKPDILLTHAPCLSILDDGIGIEPLLTAFSYQENNIKHHMFGHNHLHGGEKKYIEGFDCTFHNNATTYGVIDV